MARCNLGMVQHASDCLWFLVYWGGVAPVAYAKFEGIILPLEGGVCRLARITSFLRKAARRLRMLAATGSMLV
jgi:hypothetical protein